MFDEEGIIDHILELEQAILDWERYQKVSLEELIKDRDKRNMVLHAMLVSIQASIDIANHIIAERKLTRSSTYRESFEILSNENIIPSELGNHLADLTGFRNVLIHIYWKLNLEEAYGILQNDLPIKKEFVTQVKNLIKNSK